MVKKRNQQLTHIWNYHNRVVKHHNIKSYRGKAHSWFLLLTFTYFIILVSLGYIIIGQQGVWYLHCAPTVRPGLSWHRSKLVMSSNLFIHLVSVVKIFPKPHCLKVLKHLHSKRAVQKIWVRCKVLVIVLQY